MMGSGCEAVEETVENLTKKGEKIGLVKVRLYRPFSSRALRGPRLPKSVKILGDHGSAPRKPGSAGETAVPGCHYGLGRSGCDGVCASVGGRYGPVLEGIHPGHGQGIFDEMQKPQPKNHFTVGINDDVTHNSNRLRSQLQHPKPTTSCARLLWPGRRRHRGRKQELDQIIGEETDNYAQATSSTTPRSRARSRSRTCASARARSRAPTSTARPNFVGVHQFGSFERYNVLGCREGRNPADQQPVWRGAPGASCPARCSSRSSISN